MCVSVHGVLRVLGLTLRRPPNDPPTQSADKRRLPFKDRLSTYLLVDEGGKGKGPSGSKLAGKGGSGSSRKDGVVHGGAILRYLGRRHGMLGGWVGGVVVCGCGWWCCKGEEEEGR